MGRCSHLLAGRMLYRLRSYVPRGRNRRHRTADDVLVLNDSPQRCEHHRSGSDQLGIMLVHNFANRGSLLRIANMESKQIPV